MEKSGLASQTLQRMWATWPGYVGYVFTFWNVQLNGNGAVLIDKLENGEGLGCETLSAWPT